MYIGHRDLWEWSAPPNCKGCMREMGTHYACLDGHLVKRREEEQRDSLAHNLPEVNAQVPRLVRVNVHTWYLLSVW